MLFKTIFHLILVTIVMTFLSNCDSTQEKHKQALEDKLVESFSGSEKSVRDRVNNIVTASKTKDYSRAMNELAILSVKQQSNSTQKQAIDLLMNKLRYNLEEAEFNGTTKK